MKVLAVLLLCAFAAVQGRSAVAQSSRSVAVLGENPWVVHLRLAVSTSGLLKSCVGSLINSRWVLTSADCVADVRFVWLRYGTVNVINPSLVTETSAARYHPSANLALISINRQVESTDSIAPVSLGAGTLPESASFCGFGSNADGGPGETLSCGNVALSYEDNSVIADDIAITEYDTGAPLVSDGVQVGVLVSDSTFVPVADYLEWIEAETGETFSRQAKKQDDSLLVNFVN